MSDVPQPTFNSNIDWSDLEALTDDEVAQIFEWYATSHGDGDVNLTPFVPFFVRERPAAFKRYRLQAIRNRRPAGLPTVAVAFLMQHSYVLSHDELGVYYTTICARNWGATRDEVLDALQFAFIESGPLGGNAMAGRAAAYLESWPADEPRRTGEDPWPSAWRTPDPGRSSLAADTEAISGQEHSEMRGWYTRQGLEVPAYLDDLAELAPHLLKPLRARYEHAYAAASLPRRLYPILRLNAAAANGERSELEAAAVQARALGVTREEALEAVSWAIIASSEAGVESIVRTMAPLLRSWD